MHIELQPCIASELAVDPVCCAAAEHDVCALRKWTYKTNCRRRCCCCLQSSAQASLEAWRSEEARRLARERRVLEQQSRALLSLPNKKEKQERDGLQAQIEKERADAKAAAARQKLTVERLRCTIKELQVRNRLRSGSACQQSMLCLQRITVKPRGCAVAVVLCSWSCAACRAFAVHALDHHDQTCPCISVSSLLLTQPHCYCCCAYSYIALAGPK